jgi:hypothetical protein
MSSKNSKEALSQPVVLVNDGVSSAVGDGEEEESEEVSRQRFMLGLAYMLAMGVCGIVLVAIGSNLKRNFIIKIFENIFTFSFFLDNCHAMSNIYLFFIFYFLFFRTGFKLSYHHNKGKFHFTIRVFLSIVCVV